MDDIATPEALGTHLRQLRGRLTQQTVARRSVLGPAVLTRQRVSNIENGLVPTAEQLRCYLHACGQTELFNELNTVRRNLEPTTQEIPPATEEPRPPGRWRQVLLGVGVVVVAVVSTVAVTVVSRGGQATTVVIPECAPDAICFWPEPDFAGAKLQWPPDWAGDGSHCVTLPFIARSEMNGSSQRQWGYVSKDCTGKDRTLLQPQNGTERSVVINSYIKT